MTTFKKFFQSSVVPMSTEQNTWSLFILAAVYDSTAMLLHCDYLPLVEFERECVLQSKYVEVSNNGVS